jgi:hypothetical protein
MLENLNPPRTIEDASWIKPGVTSWTWFNGDSTSDPETYKRYIDLSAEMGWQYVLLDEGWQPKTENDAQGRQTYEGVFPWVADVVQYANERGIGLFVWSTYWDLETPEKRARLREWADMGVKGIKVDFFNSETQAALRITDEIIAASADARLMLNLHGCNKPSGERRTWPHMLTREGVYGEEHFIEGPGSGANAAHTTTLPFTRGAVGPTDYTPSIADIYDKQVFSDAHRLALAVVYESGTQCFSAKPQSYYDSPAKDFLKDFPASWDESRLLAGAPGEYAVMARRKGGDWYIGSICDGARDIEIPLNFLGEGFYTASLYVDGENGVVLETGSATAADGLDVPQAERGGFVLKLTQNADAPFLDISAHWCRQNVLSMYKKGLLHWFFVPSFYPDVPITRADFVVMLLHAFAIPLEDGGPAFADAKTHWAKDYIYTAATKNIVNGVSENEFAPDAPLTREQAVTIIGRMQNLESVPDAPSFSDGGAIAAYARDYVGACAAGGILTGYEDNTFRPQNNVTRAEALVIMERTLEQ